MGSRSGGPIYTDDNRVENPRIAVAAATSSRPSSGGSSAPPDDGAAEMEAYALERQEEVDALRRISGHQVRRRPLSAIQHAAQPQAAPL